MNIPNALSLLRGICAPIFIWTVALEFWSITFAILVYAVVSDFVDGPIARRFKLVTPIGSRLDHGADFAFTCCGLIAFWLFADALVPFALIAVQTLAFLEYSLTGPLAGSAFRASRLGRYNGILYFVVVATITTQAFFQIKWVAPNVIVVFCWLLVASTVASIATRLFYRYRNRAVK